VKIRQKLLRDVFDDDRALSVEGKATAYGEASKEASGLKSFRESRGEC
jgi:hypothetical protein